jgi:16S rRNA (guanine527-N7)-methyltransferase
MSAGPEPLPPEEFRKLLELELPRWNLTAPDTAVTALARFLAELDRWRRRLNLTGRLSPFDLVSHALESVLGARFLPEGARVVDIGTGGGFPGVPLAIWRSDLELTWLEPREKRAAFLRHVARTLPVENARILVARQEELPRESFGFATSRAVTSEPEEWGDAPFLEPRGALLLWTTESKKRAADLGEHGLRWEATIPVPGSRGRAIVLFRKA